MKLDLENTISNKTRGAEQKTGGPGNAPLCIPARYKPFWEKNVGEKKTTNQKFAARFLNTGTTICSELGAYNIILHETRSKENSSQN